MGKNWSKNPKKPLGGPQIGVGIGFQVSVYPFFGPFFREIFFDVIDFIDFIDFIDLLKPNLTWPNLT